MTDTAWVCATCDKRRARDNANHLRAYQSRRQPCPLCGGAAGYAGHERSRKHQQALLNTSLQEN